MEKLVIRIINTFLSCFFSLLLFCILLDLEFSMIRVFALTGIMLLICQPWKVNK